MVWDNLVMHKGQQVRAWLAKHPRFVFHHPPVHCSWMNQVEQWLSILRRKRLRIADFASQEQAELMVPLPPMNRTEGPVTSPD